MRGAARSGYREYPHERQQCSASVLARPCAGNFRYGTLAGVLRRCAVFGLRWAAPAPLRQFSSTFMHAAAVRRRRSAPGAALHFPDFPARGHKIWWRRPRRLAMAALGLKYTGMKRAYTTTWERQKGVLRRGFSLR